MDIKLLFTCLSVLMLWFLADGKSVNIDCREQPADIVFVLDSSSSIWPPDFIKQLQFVENVTSEFNIGLSDDQIRVAILTYNDQKHVEFHLKNVSAIHNIEKIPYRSGGTNTGEALNFLASEMFKTGNGGRQNVPHIAIVITDGQSWDQNATSIAAKRARDQGIQIFAIGVGNGVNFQELRNISSDPDDRFVFNVSNYGNLQKIKQSLTKRTCEEVTKVPVEIKRTTPVYFETTTEKLQADREKLTKACGGKPADVYFLLDSSSSIGISNFNKQLGFVRDVIDIFDIALNKTRVGISTFSHDYESVISLDQYPSKEQLLSNIANVKYLRGGTDTGAALQNVVEVDFSPNKTRQEVAHVLIVMTDGLSRDPASTAAQAKLAKAGGTYVFAVGIGNNVDENELRNIASTPDSTVPNSVFHVENFDGLDTIKSVLAISTCDVAGYQQDQGGCALRGNTDLMFVYDSARQGYKYSSMIMETISQLAIKFERADGNIRTGVLSSSCTDGGRDIPFGTALLKSEYEKLAGIGYTGMDNILKTLRMSGFSTSNGGRRDASRKAILFIDSDLSTNSKREIKRAMFRNMKFTFVTIGTKVDTSHLTGLSSQKIIHVADVQSLSKVEEQISDAICKES